jgi:hypothetical protein
MEMESCICPRTWKIAKDALLGYHRSNKNNFTVAVKSSFDSL